MTRPEHITSLAHDAADDAYANWRHFRFCFVTEAGFCWADACTADALLAADEGAREVFVSAFTSRLLDLEIDSQEHDDYEDVFLARSERLTGLAEQAGWM